jgi:hypothetical protein
MLTNRFLAALTLMAGVIAVTLSLGSTPETTDLAATTSGDLEARVVAAATRTYVHGMNDEIASREVGPSGVPYLLTLLEDPDCPRRDNVVAFLAHLRSAEATPTLLRFLERPPASPDDPAEDRALLLAPLAVGHIARGGDARALDALLEMTAAGSQGGPLARAVAATAYTDTMRVDLVEAALHGLAVSEAAEARSRLRQISHGHSVPVLRDHDLRATAAQVLRLYREATGRQANSPAPGRNRQAPPADGPAIAEIVASAGATGTFTVPIPRHRVGASSEG